MGFVEIVGEVLTCTIVVTPGAMAVMVDPAGVVGVDGCEVELELGGYEEDEDADTM